MVVISNNRDNDNETNAQVFKSIRSLMHRKPSSWQAKAWIAKELDKKRRVVADIIKFPTKNFQATPMMDA